MRRQSGVSSAFLIIAMVVLAVVAVIAGALSRSSVNLKGETVTRQRQVGISEALTSYAIANRRLPCPASGTDDTGTAAPAAASDNCTDDAGVVPWSTLGLRRDDTLDGWGRKISYRVYDGATGLTRSDGASATNCNNGIPIGQVPLPGDGRCDASFRNTVADFVGPKGFNLVEEGATRTGVAFALISHGETGYGSFAAEGGGQGPAPAAGGDEAANAGGVPPYFARAHSAQGIAATDASHFDDLVQYKSVGDLVRAAQLAGREWGSLDKMVLSSSTLSPILTSLGITPGTNLGTNTIDFGSFTVQASGSTARNISLGTGTSGSGLGAIATTGSGSTAAPLNSSSSERLRFTFDTPAFSIGLTFVDFGTNFGQFERVRLRFYSGATQVGADVIKTACRSGQVLANFSASPAATFNAVEIAPISTSGGFNSTLLVGGFRTCDNSVAASLCVAPLADPAADCP